MSDATYTFRVDAPLKEQFSNAAKRQDRTGAQLLREFMREFVSGQEATSYDQWFRAQVEIGVEEANSGNTLSAEEIEAEAERWRREVAVQFADENR